MAPVERKEEKMVKNSGKRGYIKTVRDAFAEKAPAYATAKLKGLFVDDNGDCAVPFVKGCCEAVSEGFADIIIDCISRLDCLAEKINHAIQPKALKYIAIPPSSTIEATLWSALAAIEFKKISDFSILSFTGYIKKALTSIHGLERPIPYFIIDVQIAMTMTSERSELLNRLFSAFAELLRGSSASQAIWMGWVFRLIEYFIDYRRSFYGLKRSIEVPFYSPGEGTGEIYTLVVERMYGGTGAIYPHPVFATPLVLWKDAAGAIETVSHIIKKRISENGFESNQYDVIWYLKNKRSGSIVRELRGASFGAGFAMAIFSLFDNEKIGHSLCVTGSVSPEGSILPVKAVRAKFEAVARWSLKTCDNYLFIVPVEHFSELNDLQDPRASVTIEAAASVDDILALRRCA